MAVTSNNGGRLYSFGSQPVLIDCEFTVASTNANGLGITGLKGQGVKNVYMHTTQTPAAGNPNPAVGLALIQLSNNYTRLLGQFTGTVSPLTGGALNIDATDAALTVGQPYVITSVGHAAAGRCTIAPVADSSGSLASTYFSLFDSYGNTFIIWFSVSGVGSPPNLGPAAPTGTVGLQYVQQSISTNDTASTIGTDLVTTIQNLPSGISGVYSFTASGTTTVTVVNTANTQLPGVPQDGTIPTGFTFALTVNDNNILDWYGVGLPKGLTPTVGQSFIAKATGYGKSTGQVKAVGTTGIQKVELIGNPDLSLNPGPLNGISAAGGWLLVQFLAATSSSVTTVIPTAPTDTSVVKLAFYVDGRVSPSNTNAQN